MKTEAINFRISPKIKAQVKKIADDQVRSVAQQMEVIIKFYLDNHK